MNEEDIKQFKKELWFNKGFQKGKLEQKKEDIKEIDYLIKKGFDEWAGRYHKSCDCSLCKAFKQGLNELKQRLQKEIGGDEK